MATKIPEKYDADIPEGRAFGAVRGKARDVELRRRGFAIHSRPASGPNLWSRAGAVYTEDEAVEIMRRGR